MRDDKQSTTESTGMGVGYVSLIMIFAVICLTVLAVLSYQAAGANTILNTKSAAYTSEYYAADGRAKEKLLLLDENALLASAGFFEDDFIALCGETIPEVQLTSSSEGVTAEFTEPINDRLNLKVSVIFYHFSVDGVRYRINEWKSVSSVLDETEEPLGVWDGSMFN